MGGGGNRNAQVQKTQAKRAFFELVHCLAPERPGSPALTGFPEPPALIGFPEPPALIGPQKSKIDVFGLSGHLFQRYIMHTGSKNSPDLENPHQVHSAP